MLQVITPVSTSPLPTAAVSGGGTASMGSLLLTVLHFVLWLIGLIAIIVLALSTAVLLLIVPVFAVWGFFQGDYALVRRVLRYCGYSFVITIGGIIAVLLLYAVVNTVASLFTPPSSTSDPLRTAITVEQPLEVISTSPEE